MRIVVGLCGLVFAMSVSACAGDSAARRMSDTGASLINQFKVETVNFFAAQGDLNQSTAESIVWRTLDMTELTNENNIQRGAWLAQKNVDAVAIYDALSTNTADTILSTNIDLQSLQPIAVTPMTPVDSKQFDNVVSSLKAIAKTPTLEERGIFLFNEGKAVYDGYQKSVKDAAAKAQAAKNAAPSPK